jgi:preprotein translocase subunit YajC
MPEWLVSLIVIAVFVAIMMFAWRWPKRRHGLPF